MIAGLLRDCLGQAPGLLTWLRSSPTQRSLASISYLPTSLSEPALACYKVALSNQLQPRNAPKNCRFECEDVNEGLGHYKNSFDVIHLRCVFHGLKDSQALLYEMFDLLRPGGILLVGDGNFPHNEDCQLLAESQDVNLPGSRKQEIEDCCLQEDETAPVRVAPLGPYVSHHCAAELLLYGHVNAKDVQDCGGKYLPLLATLSRPYSKATPRNTLRR